MKYTTDNLIVNLTFEFSKLIILYTSELELNRKYAFSNQLFRSATSIGANVREAQNAESKADFIHKMKIAAKESEETIYWLELAPFVHQHSLLVELSQRIISIQRILNKIIGSSKTALQK